MGGTLCVTVCLDIVALCTCLVQMHEVMEASTYFTRCALGWPVLGRIECPSLGHDRPSHFALHSVKQSCFAYRRVLLLALWRCISALPCLSHGCCFPRHFLGVFTPSVSAPRLPLPQACWAALKWERTAAPVKREEHEGLAQLRQRQQLAGAVAGASAEPAALEEVGEGLSARCAASTSAGGSTPHGETWSSRGVACAADEDPDAGAPACGMEGDRSSSSSGASSSGGGAQEVPQGGDWYVPAVGEPCPGTLTRAWLNPQFCAADEQLKPWVVVPQQGGGEGHGRLGSRRRGRGQRRR